MLRLSEAFLTNGDFLESVELSLSLRFIWKTKKNSRESNISSHTSLNIYQIFYCLMFHSVCECELPCRCTGSEVQGRTSWSGWWCSLSWRGSAGGRPGGAPSVEPPSRGGTATGCPCSSPCWPAQRERGDETLFKNLHQLQSSESGTCHQPSRGRIKTFKTNSSFNSVGDESRKEIQWHYKEQLNYSLFYRSSGCIFLCAWRIILRMTVKHLWKMFYRTDIETCHPSFF